MDGLNLYITVSAIALGLGSAVLNLTGRQKYKDQSAFFEASNHELREQNTTLREETATLREQVATAQAESSQKDKTIENLKPFSEVVTTMSNNHKQVMKALSDVTKAITGKVNPEVQDGNDQRKSTK